MSRLAPYYHCGTIKFSEIKVVNASETIRFDCGKHHKLKVYIIYDINQGLQIAKSES